MKFDKTQKSHVHHVDRKILSILVYNSSKMDGRAPDYSREQQNVTGPFQNRTKHLPYNKTSNNDQFMSRKATSLLLQTNRNTAK